MATCRTRSAQPSTPCSTGCRPTRCGAPRHPSSTTYRSGAPPTAQVLRDPATAAAYAAYRMPATHAAVARALRHATDLAPGLDVRSVRRRRRWHRRRDVGGGGGVPGAGAGHRARRVGRRPGARAPGSGGTARRWWPVPRGRERCSGPGSRCPGPTSWSSATCSASSPRRCTRRWSTRPSRRRRSWCSSIEPGTPRGYAAVLAARVAAHRRGVAPAGALPAGRRLPGGRPARRLVPLRGAARPQRAAPAAQGWAARPRGREVLLRARVARPGDVRRGARAAASGHPQGARAARGLRLRRRPPGGSW